MFKLHADTWHICQQSLDLLIERTCPGPVTWQPRLSVSCQEYQKHETTYFLLFFFFFQLVKMFVFSPRPEDSSGVKWETSAISGSEETPSHVYTNHDSAHESITCLLCLEISPRV